MAGTQLQCRWISCGYLRTLLATLLSWLGTQRTPCSTSKSHPTHARPPRGTTSSLRVLLGRGHPMQTRVRRIRVRGEYLFQHWQWGSRWCNSSMPVLEGRHWTRLLVRDKTSSTSRTQTKSMLPSTGLTKRLSWTFTLLPGHKDSNLIAAKPLSVGCGSSAKQTPRQKKSGTS